MHTLHLVWADVAGGERLERRVWGGTTSIIGIKV